MSARRARLLLASMVLVVLGTSLAPSPAAARKVANPGNFVATVTSGFIRVKQQSFTFDSTTPARFTGTIDGQGNIQVPPSGVSFPPRQVDASGTTVTVRVLPANAPPNPVTGTLNPLTGAVSLRLRVWIKLDGVPTGGDCHIGTASNPIDVSFLITGTTNPPAPNQPISGTPYNSDNGTMKVVNNSFSVPAAQDCGLATGTVNDSLGLPSGSGNNEAQFNLSVNPVIKPAIAPSFTATPSSGFAPLTVAFNAGASTSTAGVQNYRWDFDGNGTPDQTTGGPTTSFTYNTPGTYEARLRITDSEGDIAETTRTIVVSLAPDLAMDKSHTGSFRFGTNGTYTLSVSNSGGATAGTVTVTDNLPNGLTYVGATGTGWSCSASGQSVTCTRPSVGASSTAPPITLQVGVTRDAVPSVSNLASVSTLGDANPANNSDLDATTVNAVDLAIDKSHTGNFRPGSHAGNVFSLLVSNVGSAASFAPVTVTDTLPASLAYVSGTGDGWSCSATGQTVTCTRSAAIPAGGTAPAIQLAVSPTVPPETATTVTNSASVATQDDISSANNSDSDDVLVVDTPDAAITKSHTGNFRAGAQATYTIDVANAGPRSTSGSTTVTDTLPSGLTYVSATGTGWNCSASGQDVTCVHPDAIASDTSAAPISLTVDVGFEAIPSVTNTATVSTQGDANPANDSSSDEAIVRAIDLEITKSHAGVLRAGRDATYAIDLVNRGGSPTVGPVTVTDTLPTGLTFQSGSGQGWSCGASGQTVTCTSNDEVQGGAEAAPLTLVVAVAAGAPSSISNTATVSTADDYQPNNNSSTDTATVVEQDAAIKKTHLGGPFAIGSTRTYTLSVDNAGSVATSGGITVTDQLPAGLTYVSASGSGWTCSAVGQDVTCTHGDLAPETQAGDISLRVAVGPAAAPSVTNTATVSTPNDRNSANDSSSDEAAVVGPDLTVDSSHAGSFRVGGVGTYSLLVSNLGGGATSGQTTITDTLPAGLSFQSASGPGWSCSAAGQVVTCNRETTVPGAGSAPVVTLKVLVSAAAMPAVSNQVSVSTPGDTDSANNSDTDPTNVGAIDLDIAMARSGPLVVGSGVDYLIDLTNAGSAGTVDTIRITDTLPAGIVPVSAAGSGWACSITGQTVDCESAAAVAPSGAAPRLTISAHVTPSAAATVTNTATVATADDVNPANDSASDTATPNRDPDLSLDLSADGASFRIGSQAAYDLAVRNVGGSQSSGPVTVTTSLADGLTYLGSGGDAGWSCSATGQDVTCVRDAGSPIAAAGRSDLRLDVAVTAAAAPTATTQATVASTGDGSAANDTDSAATPVTAIDLKLTRAHQGSWQSGKPASYVLGVENLGTAATVSQTTVSDVLPSGVTYKSFSGAGWACDASLQTVTCRRSAPLGAGVKAPDLVVSVDVRDAAVPSATSTATVSTADDVNSSNDSATETVPVKARQAPPAAKARPVVVAKTVKVTRSGIATVRLRCPAAATAKCRGTLNLATRKIKVSRTRKAVVRLGRATFEVAAGQSFSLTFKVKRDPRSNFYTRNRVPGTARVTSPGLPRKTTKVTLVFPRG